MNFRVSMRYTYLQMSLDFSLSLLFFGLSLIEYRQTVTFAVYLPTTPPRKRRFQLNGGQPVRNARYLLYVNHRQSILSRLVSVYHVFDVRFACYLAFVWRLFPSLSGDAILKVGA